MKQYWFGVLQGSAFGLCLYKVHENNGGIFIIFSVDWGGADVNHTGKGVNLLVRVSPVIREVNNQKLFKNC